MSNIERRATVILIQRGDQAISGAIAEGMLAARADHTRQMPADQRTIVSAEIDRQRIAALVRVAVGNDKTDEDYRDMTTKARGLYGVSRRGGPLRRIWDRMFMGWALICYAIGEAYDAQRHVLGGPQ